jgi:undecaprenyl diphosphate synthase
VRRVIDGCIEAGVEYLTLYAFSVENWKRPKLEIAALMRLLIEFLRARHDEMLEKNIRLRVIGRIGDLPPKTLAQVEKSIAATAHNTGLTLILALSYGSRTEILEAVNKLIAEAPEELITEERFSRALYTADYPDPDLLIRTSGEMRLSNFLLWQMSYAEIYVTKKLWPEFSQKDFLDAVQDFAHRERRYGGI